MSTRGSVKGILQDTAGNPVPDAVIMIIGGSSDFNDMASVSNVKGEFFVSNIVIPGTYTLQVQAQNTTKKLEVAVQSKDSIIRINL